MSDLLNCVSRYESKFSKSPFENDIPTLHFCEVLAKELRKAERKIIELETEKINPGLMLGELKKILTDEKSVNVIL